MLPSVKIAVGEKCRRSKKPSVKMAGQQLRRSKLPSVKYSVGQKTWNLLDHSDIHFSSSSLTYSFSAKHILHVLLWLIMTSWLQTSVQTCKRQAWQFWVFGFLGYSKAWDFGFLPYLKNKSVFQIAKHVHAKFQLSSL
jgi:hypothetical protein